jgi:hypothetical protein
METVLVFVGLKVAEILAFIFIPYFLGKGLIKIPKMYEFWNEPKEKMPIWILGSLFLLVIFLFGSLIAIMFELNWQWACKIVS